MGFFPFRRWGTSCALRCAAFVLALRARLLGRSRLLAAALAAHPFNPRHHHHTQSHEYTPEGGTGFVGSLVIELLLRTTDVSRLYVLARGKRGAGPRERVARLLHSGLFRLVRDRQDLLAKVCVVEGDLSMEGLGLAADDLAAITSSATHVVHAASVIDVEADVQRTLRGNYLGTRRLLLAASRMPLLKAAVAVSAAAANVHLPRGATVDEALYPLRFGDQEVDDASLVEDLLSLPPEAANARAQMYLDLWGYPNTWSLGKNLTEKLVAQFHA